MRTTNLTIFAFLLAAGVASAPGCGSTNDGSGGFQDDAGIGAESGGGPGPDLGGGDAAPGKPITSITVDPPTALLEVLNGAIVTQQFKATAHFSDGSTQPLTNVGWTATNAPVGGISGQGLYTPRGGQGGVVTINATAGTSKGSAQLTVKIHVTDNSANADAGTQGALKGASNPDATVVWEYPYDTTVFPRGINAPVLMWKNAAAADVYYVHVKSPTYELESFSTAPPPSRFTIGPQTWTDFSNSTTGAADVQVARWDGKAATVVTHQTWSIADGSMRGTIYYWAINAGRVLRIKPGASAPDDFLAGLTVGGRAQYCPSCHTVSANGGALVMNISADPTAPWPNEDSMNYSLTSSSSSYDGMHVTTGMSQWAEAAVTPDGKTIVENWAPLRGTNASAQSGAFDSATAQPIAGSNLDALKPWMPSFSPDNKLFLYVHETSGDLRGMDWDGAHATNDRLIVGKGSDSSVASIQFPTASPDHKWVVYQRGPGLGSLGIPGNLYIAPTDGSGAETRLANLNGDAYPFAEGARDKNLSFEPTFAPVAAGGYFWVVFHSRRTYGNVLTGAAFTAEGQGTKQLWVAAIDQTPGAGKDPSHPAFWLPGQDPTTLNMRGYWALDPCKGDGQGCASGTECCGGFCDGSGDGGAPVCGSQSGACSQNGDRCTTTADCCNAPLGVTCINSVCSEPTPK
jgi:hypothetical protein